MSEPPRRQRFQVHLSTAIVMMFVAGGLIGLNINGKVHTQRYEGTEYPRAFTVTWKDIGFPVRTNVYPLNTDDAPRNFVSNEVGQAKVLVWGTVVLNVIFAVLLLYAVWFLCELLIAPRSGRAFDD